MVNHLIKLKYIQNHSIDDIFIHTCKGFGKLNKNQQNQNSCNRLNIIKFLIKHFSEHTFNIYDALIEVCTYGYLNIVKYFVKKFGTGYLKLPNPSSEKDNAPLIMASGNGHLDIVKYLISKDAGFVPNPSGTSGALIHTNYNNTFSWQLIIIELMLLSI